MERSKKKVVARRMVLTTHSVLTRPSYYHRRREERSGSGGETIAAPRPSPRCELSLCLDPIDLNRRTWRCSTGGQDACVNSSEQLQDACNSSRWPARRSR